MANLPFTVEENSRNVHTVRMDARSGDEFWFLLSADRHHDNPDTDQALEKKHLDQAVDRRAGIIDIGDLFCAMQGKFDKRADKSKVRPEHQGGDYLDLLVNTGASFFHPYSQNIVLLGKGNHETAIRKNHETDLTERLAELMGAKAKTKVHVGGYTGWVRFMFNRSGHCISKRLYYYHGFGGGGPVTRGVIQTNRTAMYLPDADIVASGHTHDEWTVPIARARLSDAGVPYHDEQLHVRVPSYKDEFKDGAGGWHVERGGPPKPKGAVWLKFTVRTRPDRVEVETFRAK